jgi:hypothetical protein
MYFKYFLIDALMKRINDLLINEASLCSDISFLRERKNELQNCLNDEFDEFDTDDYRYKTILAFIKKLENGKYTD